MSLILDALRRADRTRERDVARRVTQTLPPRARTPSRWPWALAVVVVVGGGIASWLRWTVPTSAPPAPVTVTVSASPRGSSLAEITIPDARPAAASAVADAPLLGALPPAVRAAMPDVTLSAHVWSDEPSKRFVMVDMKVHRDGEWVRDGLQLVAVTHDGAVFAWRGSRFRVPAR